MRKIAIIGIGFALSGCLSAATVWDKPGATPGDFARDDARCRLMAQGMNPAGNYVVIGRPGEVIGAALGDAIATGIRQANTERDCLIASGYTPRDPTASPSIDASVPPAPAGPPPQAPQQ